MKLKRLIPLGVLMCWGCGAPQKPKNTLVPVKITVAFPERSSSTQRDHAKPLQVTSTAEVGSPTGDIILEADAAFIPKTQDLDRILMPPKELIANGEKLFTHKRAFRWLTYQIRRDGEAIITNSIPIEKPDVFEIAPIEVEALRGSVLSASISLMQVDFMDERDAKDFCTTGAPGLVRSWMGSRTYEVSGDGALEITMQDAGQSTLHMAAVRFDTALVRDLKTAETRHMLFDRLTQQSLNRIICPVSEIPVSFDQNSTIGTTDSFSTASMYRHFRVLMFSYPLKSHMLGLASPTFKTLLSAQETEDPERLLDDNRAVTEMGITAAAFSESSTNDLIRVPPQKLFGSSWILDPQVVFARNDNVVASEVQNATLSLHVRTASGYMLGQPDFLKVANTGDARCVLSFKEDPTARGGTVILQKCTGNGTVAVHALAGFVRTDKGQESLFVRSMEIPVSNPIVSGTPAPIATATTGTTSGTLSGTTDSKTVTGTDSTVVK